MPVKLPDFQLEWSQKQIERVWQRGCFRNPCPDLFLLLEVLPIIVYCRNTLARHHPVKLIFSD